MRLSNVAKLFIAIPMLLVLVLTATQNVVANTDTLFVMGRIPNSSDTTLLSGTIAPFSVTPVGTDAGRFSGIDFEPGTGTFFASSGDGGPNAKSLFTIDTGTGAATLVGPFGIGPSDPPIADLAFGTDGTLYGAGFTDLYEINTGTGMATVVGSFVPGGFSFPDGIEALAVDPTTGILYGMEWRNSGLYTIDTSSGAATLIGTFTDFSTPSLLVPAGMGIDSTGNFFVSIGGGIGDIYSLDLDTFTSTLVGNAFNGSVTDIAFLIPEPTGIALALLGLTLSCSCIRRKKATVREQHCDGPRLTDTRRR